MKSVNVFYTFPPVETLHATSLQAGNGFQSPP